MKNTRFTEAKLAIHAYARTLISTGFAICMVSLVACAGNKVVEKPAQPLPVEALLVPAAEVTDSALGPRIVDRRPASDKAREMHSLLIFSCDYGVSTLEEKAGVVSGPGHLRNEMAAVEGDPWRGHEVEVRHYAVYLNEKRLLKSNAAAAKPQVPGASILGDALGAGIGAAILNAGDECEASKMHGGWFAGNEIRNVLSPVIVEMIVSIDGRVYKQRSVYSPRRGIDRKLRNPADDREIEQAETKANRALLAGLVRPEGASNLQPVAPSAPAGAKVPVGTDDGFINFPSPGRAQ